RPPRCDQSLRWTYPLGAQGWTLLRGDHRLRPGGSGAGRAPALAGRGVAAPTHRPGGGGVVLPGLAIPGAVARWALTDAGVDSPWARRAGTEDRVTTESGTTEAQEAVRTAAPRRFPVVAVALLCLGIAGLLWSVVLEGRRPRPSPQGRTAPEFRL